MNEIQNIQLQLIPEAIQKAYFLRSQDFQNAATSFLLKLSITFSDANQVTTPVNIAVIHKSLQQLVQAEPELICSLIKIGETSEGFFPDLNNVESASEYIRAVQASEAAIKRFIDQIDYCIHANDCSSVTQIDNALDLRFRDYRTYHDIRRIYWYLYCELKLTLRLLAPVEISHFNMVLGENYQFWIKLRSQDLKILNELAQTPVPNNEADLIQLNKYLQNFLLTKKPGEQKDVKILNEVADISPVYDPNTVSLTPKILKSRKHLNEVAIADSAPVILTNEFFDFLYCVAWCNQNNKDPLKAGDRLSDSYKEEILSGSFYENRGGRLEYSWSKKNELNKKYNACYVVNKKLGIELIKTTNKEFHINPQYTVQLFPYPKTI